MYDQSFNAITLARELKKSDFLINRQLRDKKFREAQIEFAVMRAATGFSPDQLLMKSSLRGKSIFTIKEFADELVMRKISRNIDHIGRIRYPHRDKLVLNIKNLISEGISYRVYRLDINSFYESIPIVSAIESIEKLPYLSHATKRYVTAILKYYMNDEERGLPRGIGLSSIISELILKDFDKNISIMDGVYYYGRFVDDILIITNLTKDEKMQIAEIEKNLPAGLSLNSNKQEIRSAIDSVKPIKKSLTPKLILSFDFLGYKFLVHEPIEDGKKRPGAYFRDVHLDIADQKVKKIKTRIVHSLLSFIDDNDFELLDLRLKYLTSNFSVTDSERLQKRLAGIYHNYWLVDLNKSNSLPNLDLFLRKAILSSKGVVFKKFYSSSSYNQRRQLLKNSFVRGFKDKVYLHFSKIDLANIKRCWNYV